MFVFGSVVELLTEGLVWGGRVHPYGSMCWGKGASAMCTCGSACLRSHVTRDGRNSPLSSLAGLLRYAFHEEGMSSPNRILKK